MIEYKEAIYKFDKKDIEKFLEKYNLTLEEDVEYTIIAMDNDEIVGTGSVSGNVLKCFAVDDDYRGFGITNAIISRLLEYEYKNGRNHLFIFTKPKNSKIFANLGFSEVARVDDVVLFDSDIKCLYNILKKIEDKDESGVIIVNANPMTKGHLQLIEKAASEVKKLHVFMVLEDKSDFPYEDRYNIVKEATEHLDNVVIHRGNEYIISRATFPTYFYKDKKIIIKSYSTLDITIFAEYFVKALNIKKRFVGTEVTDVVTRVYNEEMKRILPEYGVEVVEVPRFELEGNDIISATKVRKYLKEKNYDEAFKYLPEATIKYLKSDKAKESLENLR